MEIGKKKKSLAGLFLKFAVLFCVNTIIIVVGCLLLLIGSTETGATLPSNYSEMVLTENASEIQSAGNAVEKRIPQGCTYGIYDASGQWKSGDFKEAEQKVAWSKYEKNNNFVSAGKYYKFIKQDNGNICIIKYSLYMKYSWDKLNDILPSPEILSFIADIVLFILNAIFLSRHFAKKLNAQLEELRNITEKIAENDLEFEAADSDIREIDDVMTSLETMKDALKESLSAQWDMEQQKRQQLNALAHDIKTPLTIIKGNAELLAESELSPENKECAEYILANAGDIEQYLERMRQVLYGNVTNQSTQKITCVQLEELLREAAVQVVAAGKTQVVFCGLKDVPEKSKVSDAIVAESKKETNIKGENEYENTFEKKVRLQDRVVMCNLENLLRAWKNVLSNAVEYTEQARGIEIHLQLHRQNEKEYIVASVRDYGPGFSAQDLEYADQEFYSGDASRHNRNHQGLGLAIARRFLEEQGGKLTFGNWEDGGAEVTCWIGLSVQ